MPRGAPFRERIPIEDRFWSKVNKEGPIPEHRPELGPCWLWTASLDACGYGRFGIGSRADGTRTNKTAHHWIYERVNGPLPAGYEPDHLCRNRACVRPDHLEAVTSAENKRRADLSGNGAWQRVKTHCPYGHAYSPENTKVFRGMKKCRECDRLRHQAIRALKRSAFSSLGR